MMELGVDEGPASKLMSQVPAIVKALHKLLKDRSVKTRQGCFHILTELIIVLPGALSQHIPALIPGIFQKSSILNFVFQSIEIVVQTPRLLSGYSDRIYPN